MDRWRKVGHYSKLLLLFLLLLGCGDSCCCFTEPSPRGTPITVEEAKEEMVFTLYLPTYLPSYVDPKPRIFRTQYESSLPPNAEIYYIRESQETERLFMIFATRAGSTSRTHYATSEEQLIPLADGSLAVNRSASFDKSGVQKADLIEGPPYQTSLWWDLGRGENKAWYTIYSTFSLSETLKIVNSMEPIP